MTIKHKILLSYIKDLSMNTSLSIAFLAGLISFLSPCVLPLIPGYISYISGTTYNQLVEKKGSLVVGPSGTFGIIVDFGTPLFHSADLYHQTVRVYWSNSEITLEFRENLKLID